MADGGRNTLRDSTFKGQKLRILTLTEFAVLVPMEEWDEAFEALCEWMLRYRTMVRAFHVVTKQLVKDWDDLKERDAFLGGIGDPSLNRFMFTSRFPKPERPFTDAIENPTLTDVKQALRRLRAVETAYKQSAASAAATTADDVTIHKIRVTSISDFAVSIPMKEWKGAKAKLSEHLKMVRQLAIDSRLVYKFSLRKRLNDRELEAFLGGLSHPEMRRFYYEARTPKVEAKNCKKEEQAVRNKAVRAVFSLSARDKKADGGAGAPDAAV